ncbi:MAG: tol-pal system protein YbgF [Rhodospirillales bacterium]
MDGKMMRPAGRRFLASISVSVLAGVLLPAHPAAAQSGGAVELGPGGGTSAPAAARLDSRMTQLEQDLRSVTGRVESLSHQVRQLNDKLEKLSSDLDMRFDQMRTSGAAGAAATGAAAGAAVGAAGTAGPRVLGGRSEDEAAARPAYPPAAVPPAAAPSAVPPSPSPTAPAAPAETRQAAIPQGSSKEQYAAAFALMQKGNYAAAGAAFSDFLSRYPDDALAENARYWLGESYYARGDYSRAAETFFEAYDKNKTGPKAPDTLLKLGMALGNLDKKKEACASFRELSRAFPNAAAAIKDKAAQESKRLGCG